MASYDDPIRETYSFVGIDFGAASETKSYTLVGPKGRRGLVRDIMVNVTEAMVGTTTVPEITVGDSASTTSLRQTEYARFRLGTAAGSGYSTDVGAIRARSLVVGNPTPPKLDDFEGHVELETAFIPADTDFVITLLEGDGGTEAGAGDVYVTVDWF